MPHLTTPNIYHIQLDINSITQNNLKQCKIFKKPSPTYNKTLNYKIKLNKKDISFTMWLIWVYTIPNTYNTTNQYQREGFWK